ncbi:DUF3144 domain-containing protein [Massilia sp. S19_KUP03_FR1]|uniref:DUF3144 domain-containing protein n=1 Tax=Massilia sp. S19_KUP03_FR1 TaxID=3025503 RepID=UPI002FCDD514
MSDNIPDPAFWERLNAVINVVNEQCSAAAPNEVGSSTMYAAARFNAFILAKTTGSAENMKLERERALAYFTGQFRLMLESNLDDFTENFVDYMKPTPK